MSKYKTYSQKFPSHESRLTHLQKWMEAIQCPLTVRWQVDNRTRYVFERDGVAVICGVYFSQACIFLSGFTQGSRAVRVAITEIEEEEAT